MAQKCRVVLVDDHTLFRNGLKGLLGASGECEVVGEAVSGEDFLNKYEQGLAFDVVLLDIDMSGMSGFEVAEKLLAKDPQAKIITLSMHGDQEYYFRMVSVGVKGFLLKSSDLDEVLSGIRVVNEGGSYFSQELLKSLVVTLRSGIDEQHESLLSERELEILGLICHGLSNQEIGEKLYISKRTVDKHRANILEKTGSKNTAQLIVYAIKNSLIEI